MNRSPTQRKGAADIPVCSYDGSFPASIPLTHRGDFSASLALALGLHLAAMLLCGARKGDAEVPPRLSQPATTRVTLRMGPVASQPSSTTQASAPRPETVMVPRQTPVPDPASAVPPPSPASTAISRALAAPPAATAAPLLQSSVPLLPFSVPATVPNDLPGGVPKGLSTAESALAEARIAAADFDGDLDAAPTPQTTIRPVYPYGSRQRGESGSVEAVVHVSERGRPTRVAITSSSGFEALDQAARTALRAARFEPARRGSIAVPARLRLTFIFRLD